MISIVSDLLNIIIYVIAFVFLLDWVHGVLLNLDSILLDLDTPP